MAGIKPSALAKAVKIMTPKKERVTEAQLRGTIVYQGTEHYIRLDGATDDALTPIANIEEGASDAGFVHGDRVLVLIKNHQAIITKNLTTGLQAQNAKTANNFVSAILGANITAERIIANDTFTNTLRANNITADDIIAGKATIDNLDSNYAHISNGVIDNATIDEADVNGLSANYAHITSGVIDNATIDEADVNNLNTKYAHITNGVIDNATIDDADVNNLDTNYAHISNGVIDNATIDEADVNGLSANYAHISNGVIDNAKIGYADVDGLSTHYANIDLANVNNAWIENGLIKDAAISDAQILDVSANKLTTGTIDAGRINVINLNADNLTVGTINGQRIGNASIDLDKLSQEVPTKEYLDTVQRELQEQIDGAINTWTGSDIPTLSNYPASSWPDAKTRDAHVGDIYYVADESSDYNGYCYRFVGIPYDASVFEMPDDKQLAFPDNKLLAIYAEEQAYKWVLIKDSDVTKALAELVVVRGDVSGLKSFQTTTTSWMTNTDDELSSVKGRTTSLETNMGSKVDVSTFNAVKQTVDENSASITTLQTTVTQKADSSTVQTLSNTVNTISQTATGNASKIENLTATLGTNADGTTKTGDIVHRTSAVEQDLSGFKTTVSQTYHKTSDFNTYKTANDSAVAAAKKAGDDAQDDLDSYKTTNNAAVAAAKKAGDDAQDDLDAYKTTVSETYATKTSLTQTANSIRSDVSETYATKVSVPTSVSQLTNDSGYATTTQAQGYADTAESNAKADTNTKLASYSTTVQMNSAIDQKANQITQTVSETYQTISDMSNYSTTSQMNSAIDQKAGEITTSVSSTYETKSDATSKLNTAKGYTDTEITSAKAAIKITTDNISSEVSRKVGNDEVISRINQSAEEIKIEASKVNIVGVITAINNDSTTTIDGGKISTGSITVGSLESSIQKVIEAANDDLRLDAEYVWGTTSVTINAKLYKNGVDIHTDFPSYMFTWNKEVQNGVTRLGTGYSITVPRTELTYAGAIILDFLVGEPLILNLPTDGMLLMPDNKLLTLTIGKEYL